MEAIKEVTWEAYEEAKQALAERGLSAEEYEQELKQIIEELEI